MATLLNSLTTTNLVLSPTPVSGRRNLAVKIRARPSVSLSRSLRRSSRLSPLRLSSDAQNTTSQVTEVTDDSWQSLVLDSETPVLVDFWAPWCGPCRMIDPIIDQLAKEYAGRLSCYKVNTDNSPSIASRYGVRSVPTVIFFKDGEKKDAVIGAVPKPTLISSIDRYL